jgi:hypothetical protein
MPEGDFGGCTPTPRLALPNDKKEGIPMLHMRSLATTLALLLTLWFILDRLRIVILVNVPWWGFLILALVLFLLLDYLIARILRARP